MKKNSLSLSETDRLFDVLEAILKARGNVPEFLEDKAYITCGTGVYQLEVKMRARRVEARPTLI